MKIIQYNILDGCKEEKQYLQLKNWVNKQNADIISFNELNQWDSLEFHEEMNQLGFKSTHLLKMESSPYYMGIASRLPMNVIREMESDPIYHGLLHVQIKDVHFLIVHLTPFESTSREAETKNIVEYVKNIQEPIVVMGDFNTLSPLDSEHYREQSTYDRLVQSEILTRQHTLQGEINYRPMQILLESGFTDICCSDKFKHTFPSQINNPDKNTAHLRIDYALVNHVLTSKYVTECRISHDSELELISDHYPIIFNLKE